jgi:hypothetical protein
MRPVRKVLQRNGMFRLSIVLLIPILLLGLDFWFFPLLYSIHVPNAGENLNLNKLLAEKKMRLGTYQAYDIYVSIDDIRDPANLDFISGRPNALIISAFISDDDDGQ